MAYHSPIEVARFLLRHFPNVSDVFQYEAFQTYTAEMIDAVINEAARFANETLAPLNQTGDCEGAKWENGQVRMPSGFVAAYRQFVANGWNSLPFDAAFGGQGAPAVLDCAISEFWSGANMAFALCPLLNQSAVALVENHASSELKARYLPKMVTGEWPSTMCLTEPQAGSDLGMVRVQAITHQDHYLIKGTKIFITYGSHDMSDNIVHLVLARLPDAPAGTKGISLFLVPNILPDGTLNDISCVSIENKMGIHASPTCVMAFGNHHGAVGYLIGEQNQGLSYMFTMMNHARLAVGVEGLAIAEASTQKARQYANERIQGGNKTIIRHPDVQRTLLDNMSDVLILRALCFLTASFADHARFCQDSAMQKSYQRFLSILTPIIKAYGSEIGFASASRAMQVLGGIGYIEESGMPQYLRDVRIGMIYEGTNGIQAQDLLVRKIGKDQGVSMFALLEYCRTLAHNSETVSAIELFKQVTALQVDRINGKTGDALYNALFSSSHYLQLAAIVFGCVVADCLLELTNKPFADEDPAFIQEIRTLGSYYKQSKLPQVAALCSQVKIEFNALI